MARIYPGNRVCDFRGLVGGPGLVRSAFIPAPLSNSWCHLRRLSGKLGSPIKPLARTGGVTLALALLGFARFRGDIGETGI